MNEELLKECIDLGYSIREIASCSKVSPTTVSYWLKKFGLKTQRAYKVNVGLPADWDDVFSSAVRHNISIAGVLRDLNRAAVGTNYRLVHSEVNRLGLSTSHWKGQRHGTSPQKTIPWDKVLVEGSPYSLGSRRKQRLIREGLLINKCELCGIGTEWNGNPLVLRLDHKNGVRNDHRLSNLRMLCPNCDSQTDTYCGRNKPS